jgi:PAS domain-containing protein
MAPTEPAGGGQRRAVAAWLELDREGRYVDASVEFQVIFGYALAEIRAKRVGDFSSPAVAAAAGKVWAEVVAGRRLPRTAGAIMLTASGMPLAVHSVSLEQVAPDRWRSAIEIVDATDPMLRFPTAARVLELWRQLERQAATLDEDDPLRERTTAEGEQLRTLLAATFALRLRELERAEDGDGASSRG